ncbi:MAG: PspA/IM30 family protein [Propionibacteriaceae bacterium]|nr:PspA/IM30 family protein [Propionibacteriaceae bacterium]
MASIIDRIKLIFSSKANKMLDKVEDPRETLDYSYQKQQELLQRVRRGVADVATSRKRVELQINQMQGQVDKFTAAAQQALTAGREDLAREALTRKSGLQQQITDLTAQRDQLAAEEDKLVQASTQLQARVQAFATQKETIKATYSAAQAQVQVNDAFAGLSDELGDVGQTIQRAQNKTQEMQARATAVDELLSSGALEDPTGTFKDDITRQLDAMASQSAVDNELESMKAQLGIAAAPAAPAVEAAPEAAADDAVDAVEDEIIAAEADAAPTDK